MSGASFSELRAASATRSPSPAKRRASDALNPLPAPTINAVSYFGFGMFDFLA